MKTPYIHLAICDSYPLFATGLQSIISNFPNCVVTAIAIDGDSLIEKIEQSPVIPDVCLLDVSIPDTNGYDTLCVIKKKWPTIKVIVLAHYHNEFTIAKIFRDGAAAYLPKGSDCSELLRAINSVHSKGFYHQDFVSKCLVDAMQKKDVLDLTGKEKLFLSYCCSDLTYLDIAREMNVSHRTVDGYRDSLFNKLRVSSRSALVMFVLQTRLVIPYTMLQSVDALAG